MRKLGSTLVIAMLLMAVAAIIFEPPAKAESEQAAIVKISPPVAPASAATGAGAVAPNFNKEMRTHTTGVPVANNEQEVREVTTRARNGVHQRRASLMTTELVPPNTSYTLRC